MPRQHASRSWLAPAPGLCRHRSPHRWVPLLDPLNIASAFVPVVGEARYANLLARAASPLGRAGVRAGVGALRVQSARQSLSLYLCLRRLRIKRTMGFLTASQHRAWWSVWRRLAYRGRRHIDALKRRVVGEPDAQPSVAAAIRPEPTARRQVDYGRLFDDDPDVALSSPLRAALRPIRRTFTRQHAARPSKRFGHPLCPIGLATLQTFGRS